MILARRLVVRGRVQGVWFRDAMVEAARATGASLPLAGFVRNLDDGSVEALLQGESGDVMHMIAWSRRGPPKARVSEVLVEEVAPDPALDAFERR